jgi:prolyl 4-hydroxylase
MSSPPSRKGIIVLLILGVIAIVLFVALYRIATPVIQGPTAETFQGPTAGTFVVRRLENLLTSEQCDNIVAKSREVGLKDAETIDRNTSTYSSVNNKSRKSKTVFLSHDALPETAFLAQRAEELSDIPMSHQEQLQVAFYDVGGDFKDHFDACDETPDVCEPFNHGSGQRVWTLLVYLNDDFEGGETYFSAVDVTIKPKKGMGILFRNIDPVTGQIDRKSIHRGNPVLSGNKWICTKWVHERPWS